MDPHHKTLNIKLSGVFEKFVGKEHKGGKLSSTVKWDDFEIMTTYSSWISSMMFL